MPRYPVNGHVEEHRRHCTALSDASLHLKAGFAVAYSACEFDVEALDDVDNLLLVHCTAIRWMMILARILLGTDSKVIPRQLLQFLRAPFLGIFAMTPSVQSLGNFFPS